MVGNGCLVGYIRKAGLLYNKNKEQIQPASLSPSNLLNWQKVKWKLHNKYKSNIIFTHSCGNLSIKNAYLYILIII